MAKVLIFLDSVEISVYQNLGITEDIVLLKVKRQLVQRTNCLFYLTTITFIS
jgi:hypothetical protein